MKGAISEGVVPRLLRELYVGRRNGTLYLSRGEETQRVRVRGGHIVNAHTNVVGERLGEILVARGLLTAADLERATDVVLRETKRLGEVLLDLGLMDRSGLEDAVALHVRGLLAKVFTWNEGSYSFQEEDESAGEELTLKLSTAELILAGVRAIRDPDVVSYNLGDLDRVLALSEDPLLRFQHLALSPTDGFVLSRVDGTLSAREIEQMIPVAPEEVRRSLLGLLSTGIVEFSEERRPRSEVDTGFSRSPDAPTAGRPPASPPPAAAPPAAPPPESPTATPPEAAPPEALTPTATSTAPPAAPVAPPAAAGRTPQAPPAAVPSAPPAAAPPPPAAPPPAAPAAPMSPPAAPSQAASPPPPAPSPGAPPAAADAASDDPASERRREILEVYEGLQSKNHFEILGLPRASSAADVKEAYFRLARRFHPDVHHGASLGDLRDKLERVFIKLGEAYEVLRDPARRGEYEARLGRLRPKEGQAPQAPAEAAPPAARDPEEGTRRLEGAVRKAEMLYDLEKYWDAIQLAKPIVDTVPETMRLRARLVLARCYLKNPKWAKEGEQILLDAVRDDPKAAEAFALLGALYVERGLPTRAAGMFRRVVELKPEDAEARQRLAKLEPDAPSPEDGEGGLLRKIFRRS